MYILYMYIEACVYVHIYAYICTYVYICNYVYICVYLYNMYIYVYVYMIIYMHRYVRAAEKPSRLQEKERHKRSHCKLEMDTGETERIWSGGPLMFYRLQQSI